MKESSTSNQTSFTTQDDTDQTSSSQRVNGKIRYSKSFLLSFKDKDFLPPDDLKKSSIYTEGKQEQKGSFRPLPSPLIQKLPHPIQKLQSIQKLEWREQAKLKQPTFDYKKKKKLVIGKTAWRPGLVEDESTKILKQVTFILNKMTPEKYEKLKQELLNVLKVKTNKDILFSVINVIFDKAVQEHNYVFIYADLCKDLSVSDQFPEKEEFRKSLLNKCQTEFEKMPQRIIEYETASGNEDEVIEKQLKIKTKMIGTILFISEIFKRKMLSEFIVHQVIKTLLISKEPKSHDIEVLCTLLNNVGYLIDNERAKKYVDFYFKKLENIAQDKSFPTRIRFQVKDILEFRQKNWGKKKEETEWKTVKSKTFRGTRKQKISRTEERYPRKKIERGKIKKYISREEPEIGKVHKLKKTLKPTLTKEEVEEKTQSIMNIFLDDREKEDAVHSIKEINFGDKSLIVSKIIEIVSEKSSIDRNDTCSLLTICRKENIFSENDLKQGFNQAIFKALENDLYFDLPLLFTWYGEMLGKLVITNVLSLDTIENILKMHIQEKKLPMKQISKICSAIIREVKSEFDEEGDVDKEMKKNLYVFSFNILSAIAPTKEKEIESLKEKLDSETLFNPEKVAKLMDEVNNNSKIEEIIEAMKE